MSKKSTSPDVKALAANDTNLVSSNDDQKIKDQQIAEAKAKVEELSKALSEARQALRKLSGKSKEPKGPGVIASILTLVTESKKGISKSEILEKLVELFPDHAPEGLSKTISVQLPTRMSKERKVNIVKENDKFLVK